MRCLEHAILVACLLEVTARKPGNVHPLASFDDCDWEEFRASAEAVASVLGRARRGQLGESILEAVEATRARVGRNTNLGMVLLLAPLSAAEGIPSPQSIEGMLPRTTAEDCRLVYKAIRVARPGGLGHVEEADVHETPKITLVESMRLASSRDLVARQYVTGFTDVFRLSKHFCATGLPALEQEIITASLEQLAREPDSLIVRKCGMEVARDASERARRVLENNGAGLHELDAWLRGDGNRRNPGTTADLIAAALFVAIRAGRIPCFEAEAIIKYGKGIKESGLAIPAFI